MIAIVRALLAALAVLVGPAVLTDYAALHPSQWEVFHDPTQFKLLVCGRGWGKDHYGLATIFDRVSRAGPGYRVCYVGPSHDQIRDIAWDRLTDYIPPEFIAKKNEKRLEIRLKWGPLIQLKGSENVLARRGPDNNLIVFTEFAFCRPEAWPAISPTLRWPTDEAVIITSPYGPNHAYDLFRAVQGNKLWKTWQLPTWDNPFHNKAKLESDRATWSKQLFDQEYGAQFLANVGAVYVDFAPAIHCLPGIEFNAKLPEFYVGQDFNAGHYCAVIGQRQNGRIEIVDEVVTRTHIWDHVDALKRYFADRGVDHRKRVRVFTDASGDYNVTGGKTTVDTPILEAAGFNCEHDHRNPPLIDRVHAVQSVLMPGSGKPKLVISDRCHELRHAFMTQRFDSYGRPQKGNGLDDILDAGGYMVWGLEPLNLRRGGDVRVI